MGKRLLGNIHKRRELRRTSKPVVDLGTDNGI